MLTLNACASVGTVRFNVNAPSVSSFAFIDARQNYEKVTSSFREGKRIVIQVGDDHFKPPVPVILQTKLQEKLAHKLSSKEIVLTKLSIQVKLRDTPIDESGYNTAVRGLDPVSELLSRWVIVGFDRRKAFKEIDLELLGTVGSETFQASGNTMYQENEEEEIRQVILTAIEQTIVSIENIIK
jgi:hypothetical protein